MMRWPWKPALTEDEMRERRNEMVERRGYGMIELPTDAASDLDITEYAGGLPPALVDEFSLG